jgi:hypothetical protein
MLADLYKRFFGRKNATEYVSLNCFEMEEERIVFPSALVKKTEEIFQHEVCVLVIF